MCLCVYVYVYVYTEGGKEGGIRMDTTTRTNTAQNRHRNANPPTTSNIERLTIADDGNAEGHKGGAISLGGSVDAEESASVFLEEVRDAYAANSHDPKYDEKGGNKVSKWFDKLSITGQKPFLEAVKAQLHSSTVLSSPHDENDPDMQVLYGRFTVAALEFKANWKRLQLIGHEHVFHTFKDGQVEKDPNHPFPISASVEETKYSAYYEEDGTIRYAKPNVANQSMKKVDMFEHLNKGISSYTKWLKYRRAAVHAVGMVL